MGEARGAVEYTVHRERSEHDVENVVGKWHLTGF